jgi:predicted DNA-binding antitoxin AbrB/MazE fold protein
MSNPGKIKVAAARYPRQPCREERAMTTQVEATLTNGVLKPDRPLALPDRARVRLTIEPIEEWSPEKARAAWEAIQARLKERPIHGGGMRFTRDELHERR